MKCLRWLHQAVLKSFLSQSTAQVLLRSSLAKQAMAEADHMVHLIGYYSVYDNMAQSSAPVLEDTWKKQKWCTSANSQRVWSAWPDGLTLSMLRTKVSEDIFAKWAFDKLMKLYWEQPSNSVCVGWTGRDEVVGRKKITMCLTLSLCRLNKQALRKLKGRSAVSRTQSL